MMGKPKIFFDLDGTVLDVSARHYRIYKRVTLAFGGAPLSKQAYWQSKQQKLPWPEMLTKSGVAFGKLDDFMAMFITEIEKPEELAQDSLIEGAAETLQRLHSEGYVMYLISLRRGHEKFLQQLKDLGIARYFAGTLSGHTDASAPELKASLIAPNLGEGKGVMVGDTEADVLVAKKIGLVSVAVTSGIRSEAILRELGPDYVLDDITSLPDVLEQL